MTFARQVVSGLDYMITRRCSERRQDRHPDDARTMRGEGQPGHRAKVVVI